MWLRLLFPGRRVGIRSVSSPSVLHPCSTQPSGVPPRTHRPRNTPKREDRAGDSSRRTCSISEWNLGVSAAPMEQSQHQPRALWSGKTCLGMAAKAELCFPMCKGRPCAFAKPSVGFGVCSGSRVSLICEPSLILKQQPPTCWWSPCPVFGMPPRLLAFVLPFPALL